MMKINTTHYDTLGLKPFACIADCENAWKTKTFAQHPDLFPQDEKAKQEEIIKQLNVAWFILGDIQRKREYDAQLQQQLHPQTDAPVKEKKKWTVKDIIMTLISMILLLRVTLWLIKAAVEHF